MKKKAANIVFSGLGGYGIITASDICAHAALYSGFDVKQSSLKGIAQRGGHVISHIKFGSKVYSPRVEAGSADFVVSIRGAARGFLSTAGVLIEMKDAEISQYGKSVNIYALGILSGFLPFPKSAWFRAIKERFGVPKRGAGPDMLEKNIRTFLDGRDLKQSAAR